jgi:hypothetical protein
MRFPSYIFKISQQISVESTLLLFTHREDIHCYSIAKNWQSFPTQRIRETADTGKKR